MKHLQILSQHNVTLQILQMFGIRNFFLLNLWLGYMEHESYEN